MNDEYKILLGVSVWLILGLVSVCMFITEKHKSNYDDNEFNISFIDLFFYVIILLMGPITGFAYLLSFINLDKSIITIKKNKINKIIGNLCKK